MPPPNPDVSIRANGVPLSQLIDDVVADYGVPIMVPSTDVDVDLWFVGPLDQALQLVAQQGDLVLRPAADGYELLPKIAARVAPSQFVDPEEMSAAVGVAYPDLAVAVAGGSLVMAGEAADAAAEIVQALNARPATWMLDVLVVELQATAARELGLDWSLGLTLSARADAGSGITATQGPVLGARAAAIVEVIGRLRSETRMASLANRGTLYLLDGQPATMRQGDQIPVPRRMTSAEGTVSVVGFEEIETGFTLTATARPVGEYVRLDLAPTISEVSGFVQNEAPILLERSAELVALVRPGEWLVVSGFDRASNRQNRTGINAASLLTSAESATDETSTIVMLVRVTSILDAVQ